MRTPSELPPLACVPAPNSTSLIAKWKKTGYEKLCCLRCIQTKVDHFCVHSVFMANGRVGHELPRVNMHLPRAQGSDSCEYYSGMCSLRFVRVDVLLASWLNK